MYIILYKSRTSCINLELDETHSIALKNVVSIVENESRLWVHYYSFVIFSIIFTLIWKEEFLVNVLGPSRQMKKEELIQNNTVNYERGKGR